MQCISSYALQIMLFVFLYRQEACHAIEFGDTVQTLTQEPALKWTWNLTVLALVSWQASHSANEYQISIA